MSAHVLAEWHCGTCRQPQLRRRPICRTCGALRPRDMRPPTRRGSWFCSGCEREQQDSVHRCVHCELKRPLPPPPLPPRRTLTKQGSRRQMPAFVPGGMVVMRSRPQKPRYDITARGGLLRINFTDTISQPRGQTNKRCRVCRLHAATAGFRHAKETHVAACDDCAMALGMYDQPCPQCMEKFDEVVLARLSVSMQ